MTSQRRKLTAALRFDTLEGRVVLSSATHPLHGAVAAHPAQAHVATVHPMTHQAPAIPNPVLVDLSPGTTGIKITDVSYDARIHLITVKGTMEISPEVPSSYDYYTPAYPSTDYIGVSATQAVNRFQSVSGYQYLNANIASATVTQIPFTGRILASAGEFESGIVSLSVTSSNPFSYNYNTLTVVARMRAAKAY